MHLPTRTAQTAPTSRPVSPRPGPWPDVDAVVPDSEPAPQAPILSALENLPPTVLDQVFAHLGVPDLAAVSATSGVLRRQVLQPLRSAAITASVFLAEYPVDGLHAAFSQIHDTSSLALADAPLRAAALTVLRLPIEHRPIWLTLLCDKVEAMAFTPRVAARLRAFIQAVGVLTSHPPVAGRGVAAFQTLMGASRDLPAEARKVLLPALATALWTGVLGDQGAGSQRDPRVLPVFRQLLAAVTQWPAADAMTVLAPLLLGMRSLHELDLEGALRAALPVVDRLGALRPLALENMRLGLVNVDAWDRRVLLIENALDTYSYQQQAQATEQVMDNLHALICRQRMWR